MLNKLTNINKTNYKSAFTLVELAIVLIIIGLITGGVIGAQSLIESAKRQSVIKDISNFKIAISAFRLEYGALPGDFDEAEDYWGTDNTANGNNNKRIVYEHPAVEEIGIWNHLGLAKLIPQEFEDFYSNTYDGTEPEKTLPLGAITGTYWALDVYLTHSGWSSSSFYNSPSIALILPIASQSGSGAFYGNSKLPSTTAKFAHGIDKKIDDGEPFYGNVGALGYTGGLNTATTDCHSSSGNNPNVSYNLTSKSVACAPIFKLQDTGGKLSELF